MSVDGQLSTPVHWPAFGMDCSNLRNFDIVVPLQKWVRESDELLSTDSKVWAQQAKVATGMYLRNRRDVGVFRVGDAQCDCLSFRSGRRGNARDGCARNKGARDSNLFEAAVNVPRGKVNAVHVDSV